MDAGRRHLRQPRLAEQLQGQGGWLLAHPGATPLAAAAAALAGWSGKRRWVETVIGQLTSRYHLKRVWARDACHLWSRWLRRLLSHTPAALPCQRAGLGSLRFADLPHHLKPVHRVMAGSRSM